MNEKIVIIILAVIVMAAIAAYFTSELISDYVTLGITPFRAKTQCDDGIDNDKDGYVDLTDPGCSSRDDESESDPTKECDDGIDNDNDGYVDMEDYGCVSPIDVDESNCGDNVCEGLETCSNCREDCKVCL